MKVFVDGGGRLRHSFFVKELEAVDASNFRSMDELGSKVGAALRALQETGLFEKVDGSLVVPPSYDEHGKEIGGDLDNVEVHLKVKEKGIPFVEMGTYVQSKSGTAKAAEESFKLDGALRSPFGFGETARISLSTGRRGTRDVSVNFSLPHVGRDLYVLNLKGALTEEDKTYYQSYRLESTSLLAELVSRSGKHTLEASWTARDEVPRALECKSSTPSLLEHTAKDASGYILSKVSASTKLALKYTGILLDTRDSSADPSKGSYANATTELCVAPGTARFAKAEVTLQKHATLGPPILGQMGLVGSLVGNFGVIVPLGVVGSFLKGPGEKKSREGGAQVEPDLSIPLSDRFTAGGPMNLRGFDMHGVGPRSFVGREGYLSPGSYQVNPDQAVGNHPIGDAIGGVGVASTSVVLSVPIPIPSENQKFGGIRAFTFATTGTVASPASWSQLAAVTRSGGAWWSCAPRVTVGGGFSVAFAPTARMEITYSVPVLKSAHDVVRGFQLGLGLTIN